MGGNISITSMPKELKENFDIFGYIEPAVLSIMKIMKNKFDPNNILNPGRYIGGI